MKNEKKSLILDDLVVDVPSMPQTKNYQEISVPWPTFTTRPAKEEEMGELIETFFLRPKGECYPNYSNRGWYFLLASGARLRMGGNK